MRTARQPTGFTKRTPATQATSSSAKLASEVDAARAEALARMEKNEAKTARVVQKEVAKAVAWWDGCVAGGQDPSGARRVHDTSVFRAPDGYATVLQSALLAGLQAAFPSMAVSVQTAEQGANMASFLGLRIYVSNYIISVPQADSALHLGRLAEARRSLAVSHVVERASKAWTKIIEAELLARARDITVQDPFADRIALGRKHSSYEDWSLSGVNYRISHSVDVVWLVQQIEQAINAKLTGVTVKLTPPSDDGSSDSALVHATAQRASATVAATAS